MDVDWSSVGSTVGQGAGFLTVALLCLAGIILSALSFSGTWLVLAAAMLAAWLGGPEFPGAVTLLVFALLCAAIEVAEWLAGMWGVQRRGGSKLAGFAALGGGIAGMVLGSMVLPVIGTLLGMMAGSFGLAYFVERRRLLKHEHALHIATGAVLARIGMLLLKVAATLAMTAALCIGMAVA